jgi:hypothetical protein
MSTPYKNSLDAWLDSDEFMTSSDPATLRAPSEQRQYLENRLKRAFEAGWNARGDDNGEAPK